MIRPRKVSTSSRSLFHTGFVLKCLNEMVTRAKCAARAQVNRMSIIQAVKCASISDISSTVVMVVQMN